MWTIGAYFVVFVIPAVLTLSSVVLYVREKKQNGGES